jgi:MFS-type transporter involved in bile tolerance (Atg22 family)
LDSSFVERRTGGDVKTSVHALGWLYFFLADIQTGVGPFLAAYLAASRWDARSTGIALTCGGLVTVAISPFAGGMVDASRSKRRLVAVATLALSMGAVLIGLGTKRLMVGACSDHPGHCREAGDGRGEGEVEAAMLK